MTEPEINDESPRYHDIAIMISSCLEEPESRVLFEQLGRGEAIEMHVRDRDTWSRLLELGVIECDGDTCRLSRVGRALWNLVADVKSEEIW